MHAPLPTTRGPEDAASAGSGGSAAHDHSASFGAPESRPSAAEFADPSAATRIGQLLRQAGALNIESAERVARGQAELGLRFGEAALRLGLVNQDDVDAAIARQFAYPFAARADSVLSPRLVAAFQSAGIQGDALRAVRSQLLLRWFGTGQHALAISGVGPGDTSSVLAANLALVFAQLGQRTLLVDANLQHGVQEALFGLHAEHASQSAHSFAGAEQPGMPQQGRSLPGFARRAPAPAVLRQAEVPRPDLAQPASSPANGPWQGSARPGLSDVLAGRAALDAIVSIPGFSTLSLLPAGTVPPNPQELLERPSFGVLHAQLGEAYDVVLYDIAPTSHGSEALAVAAHAGAALLVARKNHTPVAAVKSLADQMAGAHITVIGSVLVED